MDVAELQHQLADRAFLHDDPDAYRAGVNDAIEALVRDLLKTWEDEQAGRTAG